MTPRAVYLALAVVGALALLTLGYCQITGPSREAARQSRNDATMAQTRTESAVEAISEIGGLQERGRVTETQVLEAENAIRQAAPADRDRVARHRLCVLQHRPDCDRLLGTGPTDLEPGNAAR
ncbi:hypothetical protein [Brevundimonas sp. TWP2-3-4b1]|uniref:hypothetical protein n=1 Tax=Brevundimonas sp. TWP2-3-4b1 TaxID=2804580 RepID=UPI003CEBE9F3